MKARSRTHDGIAKIHEASEHLMDVTQEAKRKALGYSNNAVTYIKKYPIKSVLIASAVGILLGKFIL